MGDYSDAGGAIMKFVIAVAVIVLLLVGGCGLVAGRLLGSDRIGRMDAEEGRKRPKNRPDRIGKTIICDSFRVQFGKENRPVFLTRNMTNHNLAQCRTPRPKASISGRRGSLQAHPARYGRVAMGRGQWLASRRDRQRTDKPCRRPPPGGF